MRAEQATLARNTQQAIYMGQTNTKTPIRMVIQPAYADRME
jgi:hypothetical protein